MLSHDFGAGFTEPVREAQVVFRAVLDALANPGTMQHLPVAGTEMGGLGSITLTLSDHDTTIWLSPALDTEAARGFVGFHTGASIVSDPAKATFAFVARGDALPDLAKCNLGTQEYPDRSTTIVAELPSLSGGPTLVLRGPGIRDMVEISPEGLSGDFVSQWGENRELFPRGVDLLLVAGEQVIGLPRSSRIVEA
ncbi:phosphonate C-P lyase system protein PhnH [Devosia sp. BK]|uniref:phosphonate C-P lyase system protein PhnH n=1 Tax=Devosia sp. BK TaxID=2871706 RepID=UPI00293AD7FF|nr:phosphonate C-P lyase system protein PhnH [Devosia sp. BK]MDV3249908.1 phosphonate C-P lyase system protein PhnH [Devosia sp. BK]